MVGTGFSTAPVLASAAAGASLDRGAVFSARRKMPALSGVAIIHIFVDLLSVSEVLEGGPGA